MPLERDEGEYALAGQLILQGHPPYERLYNMKWPGTYYGYALIEAVFGQDIEGIHLGILFVNVAAILLVFLIARRLLDAYAAAATALAYGILSLSPSSLALAGHASHFVVVCTLAAVLVLQQAARKQPLWLYLLAGFFAGLAPVMKQPGIFFMAFMLAYWGYEEFRSRASWAAAMRRGAALLCGVLIPVAVMLGSVLLTHTFGSFRLWTISYATHYGPSRSLAEAFEAFLYGLCLSMGWGFMFWMLAGVGLATLPFDFRARARAPFLLGLLFFSLVAVCPGVIFRTHYFILLLPVVSLLCGTAVSIVRRRRWPQSPVIAIGCVLGMLLVPLSVALLGDSGIYFHLTPEAACRQIYGAGCPFVESVKIADYIRERTGPSDRIAVLGSEPEIYFYSHRPPATGHIYTYAMMEEQPFARQFQEQMIGQVEAARPKYVVHVKMKFSWLETPASDKTILEWFERYRKQKLKLVGLVERDRGGQTLFRWDERDMHENKYLRTLIAVYRRKSPK